MSAVMNSKVHIYILNEKIRTFEMTKPNKKCLNQTDLFWDIGMVNEKEFIEMNVMTNQALSNKIFYKEFVELMQFLQNSKGIEFRTIMGFDKKDTFDDDDDSFTTYKKNC